MSALEPMPFTCPGCGAKYEVVRIEPSPFETGGSTVKCARCDVVFPAVDGNALLKYFVAGTKQSLS
jgi:predicted Zn finger-like uncharacterized protein